MREFRFLSTLFVRTMLASRFEQVYDWGMSSTAAAVAHEATTHDLWTQAAEVAGRLNRAHGELVEIAAQLVEGGHWGDGGF